MNTRSTGRSSTASNSIGWARHEDAGHCRQIGQARMRDGDSAAEAGRADLLARRQQFGGQATVDAQALCRGRKLREQGLFMRDGDVLIDRLGAQQIAEVVHPGLE
jgi:hypothetical protein